MADSKKLWGLYHSALQNRLPILPFDIETVHVYARLAAELRRIGMTKPVIDLMIAASAIRNGKILATCNASDFQGIPGLVFEDWSIEAVGVGP